MNKYKEISIKPTDTILFALKKMDRNNRKLLLVQADGVFHSLLSIGDIQRAILANIDLKIPVSDIVRSEVRVAHSTDNIENIKDRMRLKRNEFMPVLSENNFIKEVIFWEDVISEERKVIPLKEKLPVVIMAGGKGTRLAPLTNVLPKPLIPIGEKTILEDIMDNFVEFGCDEFHISVNYKAEMIRYYFDTLKNPDYKIHYFEEAKPSGTAGSLCLLKNSINSTFFVTNCDIIINQDYSEILEYHKSNKNEYRWGE